MNVKLAPKFDNLKSIAILIGSWFILVGLVGLIEAGLEDLFSLAPNSLQAAALFICFALIPLLVYMYFIGRPGMEADVISVSNTIGERSQDRCAKCNAPIQSATNFCGQCGVLLDSVATVLLKSDEAANPKRLLPTKSGSGPRKIIKAAATLAVLVIAVNIFSKIASQQKRNRQGSGTQYNTIAHAQMEGFITALGMYKLDTGTFPKTNQGGLQSLRVKLTNDKSWNGPYLPNDVPKDPWGRAYLYIYPGKHGDDPDIICYGADGQPGGEGDNADIVSWKR